MNKKRTPLRALFFVMMGAGASIALLSGSNAHAFSLSPEEIIKRFMNAIVRYVAGDSYDKFEEAIENWKSKLNKLYGGESEDVAKKAAAAGVGVNKAITVEEQIYNDNAMSDAMEIKTACRKSPAPVINQAKEQLGEANQTMQEMAVRSSIEQNNRQAFTAKANETIQEMRQLDSQNGSYKIPSKLDGTLFIKDEGYANEAQAKNALEFIKTLTEHKRASLIKTSSGMASINQTIEAQVGDEVGRIADLMNATAVLNDIYLTRLRDKALAQSVIERTTDGEASILKVHANEFGMSLIDVYNYEAECAAFNHEYIKDIMTAKLDDNQTNEAVIPSPVRGYKYITQMKALENAFLERLYAQQATINKLQAILVKQKVRSNISATQQ